jgi:UDP-N-acetylglucosamine 2-epimerase (non-hydrolysing)
MKKIKVLSVIGTRPEVIKMAPVIKELQKRARAFDQTVVITGQHKEMCRPYLDLFSIVPNWDLAIMQKDQTLNSIIASIMSALPRVLADFAPDVVLVQGDTSSAFAAALAAFHGQIKVGHVEAGLRTGAKYNPFPEEMNRALIGRISDYHFAPTTRARDNLIHEGISPDYIFVTGNTSIDALKMTLAASRTQAPGPIAGLDLNGGRVIAVTTHRRESFGEPLANTLLALKEIVTRYPDVRVVLPVHYNPNVRTQVYKILDGIDRVYLIEPLEYRSFIELLDRSYLILTDSGGIQEEAPSLGKPVLVLRETTERPEGIEAGTARLIGTDSGKIVAAVATLLDDQQAYQAMACAVNPYGDGTAAIRIVDALQGDLAQIAKADTIRPRRAI